MGKRNRKSEGAAALSGEGAPLTLDRVSTGQRFVLGAVRDEQARIHAIRFGMTEGTEVTCLTRIPGGPIVLKCGRQEIAVGRKLAECINVHKCATAFAPSRPTSAEEVA